MNNYSEGVSLTYYTGDDESGNIEISMLVPEPMFDILVHKFLSFCTMIFEWDRALIKLKALEAVQGWEV